eukprot:Em0005g1692a
MADTVSAIVSCEWLKGQLDAGTKGIKVVYAPWPPKQKAQAELKQRYIAGAVFADIDAIRDQSNPLPLMFPGPDQFEQQIGQLGISNTDHVIVYDNASDTGTLSAPRAWLMFRVFGHEKVSVLDGGLPKWIASGYPTVSDIAPVSPTNFKACYNPIAVYSMKAMLDNFSSKDRSVIDARSKGRFNGTEREVIPAWLSGHIIGSTNVPSTDLLDPTTMQFISKEAIKDTFQTYGVNLDQPAVAMCSIGMRASILVLGAHILGKQVPLYDGSWGEWHQKAPKETMSLGVGWTDTKNELISPV